jgi:hypothetical protein
MRTFLPWVVVAAFVVGLAPEGNAQQDEPPVIAAFKDTSRPGTLRVQTMNGSITVRGTNRKDVSIQSRTRSSRPGIQNDKAEAKRAARRPPDPAAAAGLTRLTPRAGFTVDEDFNTIQVSTGYRSEDLEIEVPVRTNLRLSTMNRDITVTNVEGEIEASGGSGDIMLNGIVGSIVASTQSGDITAVLTRATPDKPMAFSAMSGDVNVTLPAALRANLRLRSQNGEMYTNFELQRKAPPAANPQTPFVVTREGKGVSTSQSFSFSGNPDATVYGSINGGGPEVELRTFSGNIYVRKGN